MKTKLWLQVIFISALFFSLTTPDPLRAETGVYRATLENGLRVVIVKNSLAPVVTAEMNYLVGSDEAPAGFPGTAHALEHMMFRGSPGLTAAQLSAIAAAMGGQFNADTQQNVTQYYFTVPSDDLDVALHVEADRMKGILATPETWNQERGAIEQEVARDLSDPEYLFFRDLLKRMFSGTPYEHDPLGTVDSFQKTTAEMLRKFHQTWYVPNNAILVITGDIEPDKALTGVKKLFGTIPAKKLPRRPEFKFEPLKSSSIELKTDLPYNMAIVAYRLPGYDSPDYAAAQILADVLDSERGNLYALVPQGKAISAGFDMDMMPRSATAFATAAIPPGSEGGPLITKMKEIIDGYLKDGIPPDLVEAAKKREVTENEFNKNSVEGLASEWSDALAVKGLESPDEEIAAIKKVTPADVNRVARKYLSNASAITAILVSQPLGTPNVSGPRSSGGKESFAPKQVKPVKLPPWAEEATKSPGIPKLNVNPTVTILPNGLRIIFQHESVSPTVSVSGYVKNDPGLEEPPGKEGVAQLMEKLFPYGTEKLNRLAFRQAVDQIGADISTGTDFSLQVLAERAERGLELLADNLLHPAFPETDFKIVQRQTANALKGVLNSPGFLSKQALRAGLYPKKDPTLRHATPATVKSLTLKDVRNYYKKVFRPDLTTIVLIGNISSQQAREMVDKYFGKWQAGGPKPATDLPSVPANPPTSVLIPDAKRVQDSVTLAETLGMTRSNPDYYSLQLGNHVLSGAFYATRLYRDLREETGLVYTVESMIQAQKTRSIFGVFYASAPANTAKARAIVEENLRRMQTSPIDKTELERARALLLRGIPLSESSVDQIAEGFIERTKNDLPLDEPLHAAKRYNELTAEQVRQAFSKWIRPGDFVQVTLGPMPK